MVIGNGYIDQALSEGEVRDLMSQAFAQLDLSGERVLVIIPDSTRTAPIPLMFRILNDLVGHKAAKLDYLVALGTHPAMDDAALSRLVGTSVVNGKAGPSHIYNHRWDLADSLVTVDTLSQQQVTEISGGRLSMEIPVQFNRLILEYDQLIVCGPVFPHEVVGFSGGNKYFLPGICGPDLVHTTHWLGALLTSPAIIGKIDTPVRRMIDSAAATIPKPRLCIAMVVHGQALRGFYVGPMEETWRAAATLSAKVDIVYVDKPFKRVLSVMPSLYDDIWTAAKGMYKMEPVVADGGEVIIYSPRIDEISYTHGKLLDEVGYHVRDYFVKQWDRFKDYPWAILAHSTHLRGIGTYENGAERPRIRVTLATRISRERCERLGLGYIDPDSINPDEWAGREEEGILLVPRAGEMLYRLREEEQ